MTEIRKMKMKKWWHNHESEGDPKQMQGLLSHLDLLSGMTATQTPTGV
jgi:hypothetical protein